MRVIAGKFRSRKLYSAAGLDLRPTSDKLRETLFNVLTAGHPAALADKVWLDLFAGTGAVGIEAMSRGASTTYFVDSSPAAAELIKRNLKSLGITGGFQLLPQEVPRALSSLQKKHISADFVFLDPPYRSAEAYAESLSLLAGSALLKPTTLVIAEHEKRFDPGETFTDLQRYRTLIQGNAALSFYRLR